MGPVMGGYDSVSRGSTCVRTGERDTQPSAPWWRALVTCAALGLGGCMVGPDFQPPPAPNVGGYTPERRVTPTAAAETAGGASQGFVTGLDIGGHWWTQFGSPQINAFVEEAVRNHPTIASAEFALRAARENVLQAQGALYPQALGEGSATREQVPAAQGGTTGPASLYNLYNTSVNVTYTLDVFGGLRRQVESQAAQAENQRFQLEATYLALTANVVTAALTDASLKAQIAATQSIIKGETDQLQRVRRQFELGAVSQADVLAQQATLAQTEASLPLLQKQRAQGRNRLMAYLGRLPSEDRGESVDLASLRLPSRLPLSLPADLVRQRPDIRQAEASLHQMAASVGVSTANMLPQFTLTPSAGTQSLSVPNLFSAESAAWALAANIQQKLFDAGQLYHAKEYSVASFEQTYAAYQSTVIMAFQNVADSLRAIQYDAAMLKAQAVAEKAALDSLKMVQEEFKVGATGYAIIITAQQTYQNAVIARIQAQALRFTDTVALFQSLGGGWWNRTDETARAAPRRAGYFQGPDGPATAAVRDAAPPGTPAPAGAPPAVMEVTP